MDSLLPLLMLIAMLATLLVLVIGVVSFAVYGRFYVRHANNLMRARVILQALALGLFALVLWLSVSG